MFTLARRRLNRLTRIVISVFSTLRCVTFFYCVMFCVMLLSSASHATLTDSITIGNAKALGLAHAVTADPPGIDSIHYNPAGLTRLKNRLTHYKLITGAFDIGLSFGDNVPERQQWLDDKEATGTFHEDFFNDEAANAQSSTEGASMMLPGVGMTDIPFLLVPLGGVSYSPRGSRITFANNVYTPLGVGFNRKDTDPGRFIGERLSFMLLTYLSPSVAYEFTDTLSIGATLTVNYASVGLDLPFREPHEGLVLLSDMQDLFCRAGQDPLINVCGGDILLNDQLGFLSFEVEDPFTLGFNIGLMWSPREWVSFGVVYQSEVDMNMEGDFSWKNSDAWNSFITPLLNDSGYQAFDAILGAGGWSLPTGKPENAGTAKLKMVMPEHYAFGLSVKLLPKLKVNLDYKFTGWSSWKDIPVKFSEPIDFMRLSEMLQPSLSDRQSLTFPLGLEDTWNWAFGMEYQYSSRLALRFGIEDRPASIPKEAESPLLPMGEGTFYGAGFGLALEKGGHLDVGVGYFASEVFMRGGESRLGNSLNPYEVIYNPYMGRDITAKLSTYLLEFSYSKPF